MPSYDVLVIGAGVSGLATARWLAMRGRRVAVCEAQAHLGGKIQSRKQQGYLTEQAASMLVNYRPEVNQILQACGLQDQLLERCAQATSARYVVRDNQLQAVPMHLPGLLRASLFSWPQKLRLLTEPLRPRGRPEQESVADFVRRRFGQEVLDTAMEPFISGTLASDPERANAAATLPRLSHLEQQYGSITAGILVKKLLRQRSAMQSQTLSFKDGMQSLPEQLAQHPNIDTYCSTSVSHIEPASFHGSRQGWLAHTSSGDGNRSISAKQLVLSVPAPVAARLLRTHNGQLADLLASIEYAPLNIVHTGFQAQSIPHSLNGTGFLVPKRAKAAINGNLWLSSTFSGRAPAGKVLLSSYLGGLRNPTARDWDDQQCIDKVQEDLATLMGVTGTADFAYVDRHQQALPLYLHDYPNRCRAINQQLTALPGLSLEANYMGGVAVRDRLTHSLDTASRIHQQLQLGKAAPVYPAFTIHSELEPL
ncbi:MAG: protoporphyrinogen oxidase [Gammaproteobacteria bacterium]|nr:protoporphyrinogen oxidase [Gammaproteobacteria bacterium]